MEKKEIVTSVLFGSILSNRYEDEYKEYGKYHYYFELFFGNYSNSHIDLLEYIEVFDAFYNQMETLNRDFYEKIINVDLVQHGGVHSKSPLYAIPILFDKKYYNFDSTYYEAFKVLFSACEFMKKRKVFKEVNKYHDMYREVLYSDSLRNSVDEEKYRNFQFNYHMIVGYATAYCYYMSYEPERLKDIVSFFVRNYEQIINIFELNGLTREDFVINKNGLSYFTEYYENNGSKGTLRTIM